MKDGAVYEDMLDFKALKKYMEDQLEDYNMEPGVIAMDLVLFRDAIEHGNENEPISFILCILKELCHSHSASPIKNVNGYRPTVRET